MRRLLASSQLTAIFATCALLAMGSADFAEAKVGGGGSIGSRGGKTFSAPPTTNTAPKAAAPVQKSITQPNAATASVANAARPSMFGGMRGLLFGGLMAGLFAHFFGFGMLAGLFGFIVQTALIVGLAFLAYNWFRNRRSGMPQMAAARPTYGAAPQPQAAAYRAATGPAGSAGLTVSPDDFTAFERLLGEIQLAYGRGDTHALGDRTTPEMLSYFSADLAANAAKGERNEITEPKLLQGDLSESWTEASGDYATVAMRFSLLDRIVDANTGRIIAGSATEPGQTTELWTFRRPIGGRPNQWILSAIQQAK